MRTKQQLLKHIQKPKSCGHRFLLTNQSVATDLFGSVTQRILTPLPIHCHSYFCVKCANSKKTKFRERMKKVLKNNSWHLYTFTTDKNKYTTSQAVKNINRHWNAFITTLKDHYSDIKYVRVLEISEKNSVHLHVIFNQEFPKEFLKKLWTRYHHSYIVLHKKCYDNLHIANYLTKYFAKDMSDDKTNNIFFINNLRRYSFSRNSDSIIKVESNFKLVNKFVYNLTELIALLGKQLYESELKLSECCFDYLPPPEHAALTDTFYFYN